MNKITQEKLKHLFDYHPDTGLFVRKKTVSNNAQKGSIAGYKNSQGYIVIAVNRVRYPAHRLAFLYMVGYLPENDVDHIDRDRSNNKWVNLREVSRSCNARNCDIRKSNKSGISGVSWHARDKKWLSQVRVLGKQIYLGCFKTKSEAARARWEAEKKYGFPNCNTNSSACLYLRNVCASEVLGVQL